MGLTPKTMDHCIDDIFLTSHHHHHRQFALSILEI
jgi:hypothetical protein